MSVSRSLRLAILAPLATIACLTLAVPPVGAAGAAPAPPSPATTNRSTYQPAPTSGVVAYAAVSPSGCVQTADHPHNSGHEDGRANGAVRAVCRKYSRVPNFWLTAQMWETRWWGWDRIGVRGTVSRSFVSSVATFGNDWCKKNTVRVTGNGYVLDVDARKYYASTVSVSIKNPCGL